ncbi:hypothetical protein [Acutalibacter caecimuris]|nr:hypothetical protein [Acutalibacter sp. M00118]
MALPLGSAFCNHLSGYADTDDDDSGIASLARSLGINLRFTEYVRYCWK